MIAFSLTDPDTLTKLGKLILTDLVLAGDNALVIALATRSLPKKQQFWGRLVGAGGAVVLRVLFVAIIAWLLRIPYLQLVGGLLLVWIGWKLVRPSPEAIEAAAHESHKYQAASLGQAIWIIVIADLTMSFDNVVAISNIAEGSMPLVIFGLLLSIPLVVWGSVLIAKLMEKFRWIVWLGGAVLGHVAGEIIFKDHHVLGWLGVNVPAGAATAVHDAAVTAAAPWVTYCIHGIPWLLAVLLFLVGWLFSRHAAAMAPKAEPKSA
jgi:YjbE family integral membrane protein